MMKIINSKELKKQLDEVLDLEEIYEAHEEELYSPCWQVQIDRENQQLIFLIDANKVMSYSTKKIDQKLLTVSTLGKLIKILREGDLEKLKNEISTLKAKRA